MNVGEDGRDRDPSQISNKLNSMTNHKMYAKGLADFSLLVACVNQMRNAIYMEDIGYKVTNIVLASLCIALQVSISV